MRVYHGSILTVDEKDTVVQYLVEDSGRIVFAGNELPAKWSDTPKVELGDRAALQIEMHAIGDKAFDQATRCLKAALEEHPRSDYRHGIIHACLPTDDGLDICAQYGIHLPVQPAFIDWNQEPDAYLADILGQERAAKLNPLKVYVRPRYSPFRGAGCSLYRPGSNHVAFKSL